MLPTLNTWLACFERRAASPLAIPANLGDHLPEAERDRIAPSIATFQLGEQSEGRTLLALARRHAATLAEYMAAHGIPRRTRYWSDVVFRQLRRLIGFELAITVQITAQLIGIQYYRALRARRGRTLRGVVTRMHDAFHIATAPVVWCGHRRVLYLEPARGGTAVVRSTASP